MKKVEFWIGPDGRIKVEASGFIGKECDQAIELFEEVLGKKGEVEHTSEWYKREKAQQVRAQQKG